MAEILTNTGLRLPDDFTEEQFFEAGRFLARIERGSQWAIGDWYNANRWGDKEAACERAGLNFKTASTYAVVATAFQISTRVENLSFELYRKLAIDALTPDQRTHLLAQAQHGEWSAARLTKERDKLLGRPDKVPLLTFDGHVKQVYEALPTTASTKLKKALDKAIGDLRHDFEAEVSKVASERTKEQRDRLAQIEKEAREEKETLAALRKNLDGLMTEEEYRLIRGCLHPDRAPEDRKEQFSHAFQVFTRLEKSVNRDVSEKVREARGWS